MSDTNTPTIDRPRKSTKLKSKRPKIVESAPDIQRPVEYEAVKVDPTKVENKTTLPRSRRYWVGAFVDAPFDNKHFAGIAFQKWTGVVQSDPKTGAMILDQAHRGAVVNLNEDQVKAVQAAVARSVIRTVGRREDATGNYRCDRFDVTAPSYRPSGSDQPVGKYIYMVRIRNSMPTGWREGNPPAMVE